MPKTSRNAEAAHITARYLSVETSLHDVSSFETGLDPYRKSHVLIPAFAQILGNEAAAKEYLERVGQNLRMFTPRSTSPAQVITRDVLDLYINRALSGEMNPRPLLDTAAKEWEQITKKLADKQKRSI